MWLLLAACDAPKPDTGDSGDTHGDDTGPAPPCVEGGRVTSVDAKGTNAEEGSLMVEDLDGGGAPDVLLESADGSERSANLHRGEDLSLGVTTPYVTFPGALFTSGSGFVVATMADADGDSLGEVVIGEGESFSTQATLSVWSTTGARLARFALENERESTTILPAQTSLPDVDGDGVDELLVATRGNLNSDGVTWLLPGSAVVAGGHQTSDTALLTITSERGFGGRPAVLDLDGDGVDEGLLAAELGLFVLGGERGVIAETDLPLLLDAHGYYTEVFAAEIDDDGHPELFVFGGGYDTGIQVYAGADVATAFSTVTPLAVTDATLTITTDMEDSVGEHMAIYTDGDCRPALAFHHSRDATVYRANSAQLAAGGVYPLEELSATHWDYSLVISGGHDLDADGTLDLLLSWRGGAHDVLFAPAASL